MDDSWKGNGVTLPSTQEADARRTEDMLESFKVLKLDIFKEIRVLYEISNINSNRDAQALHASSQVS
jgi:hypothetical protein